MPQLSLNRFHGFSRAEWIAAGAAMAATLAYLFVLRLLDYRAEVYFQTLRKENPASYLVHLRELKDFSAFLPEYAVINGFTEFRPKTPSFLVGRWTMRDSMLRLTPGQAPELCSDPVTFDFGLFLTIETGGVALPVQYRLAGQAIEMRSSDGAIFPIRLVSYGAQLDHIEFTPPGRTVPVYAYLCGR